MAYQQQKIEEIVKREVGAIILRDVEIPDDRIMTIMQVSVTKEKNHAKIFVSVIPDSLFEDTLEILNKNIYHTQKTLNKRLKIKPVPQIVYKTDKEAKEIVKVNEVLEHIKEE